LETNKKSAALREVERLAVKSSEKPMEFAKALAAFHAEGGAARREEAPGSIDRVLKSTGISRRILYRHLAIGQTLGHLNLKPERLAKIGWRKLAIIAQHVRKVEEGEERDALILDALNLADHSAAELHAILKGNPFKAKPHRIELLLNARQYRVFAAALRRHGAIEHKNGRGLVGKEAALTRALAAIETD